MKKGLALTFLLGMIAKILSVYIGISSVIIAIIIGVVISNCLKINDSNREGIKFSENKLLGVSIALMGFGINYKEFYSLGFEKMIKIFLIVIFTIIISILIGKLLNIDNKLSMLIGMGNAFCGSAAIIGGSKVIKSKNEHTVISIGIINLLGSGAMVVLPIIIKQFNIIDSKVAFLIGGSLQSVGQVVAAAFMFDNNVVANALIIKMFRVSLLAIIIIIMNSFLEKKLIIKLPSFIIFFIIFSLIGSNFIVSTYINSSIVYIKDMFFLMAMSAIGLSINIKNMLKSGGKPLILALLSCMLQIFFINILF